MSSKTPDWGERVQLHFLPPYCPDHNRIERLWKDLHDNVTRNHRCRTMDELLEKFATTCSKENAAHTNTCAPLKM